MLIDEAEASRRVDQDVAHSILPDHAAGEIAESLMLLDDRRWRILQRRLHNRLALQELGELRRGTIVNLRLKHHRILITSPCFPLPPIHIPLSLLHPTHP